VGECYAVVKKKYDRLPPPAAPADLTASATAT
jgi:hypothetical protein